MECLEIIEVGLQAKEVKSGCCLSDVWVVDPIDL